LSEAITNGFDERWRLEQDDDFEGLRSDPRFAAMLVAD
jgi:hypothetical protein